MKILAANAMAIAFLGATIWFVYSGHVLFALATLYGTFSMLHTYSEK